MNVREDWEARKISHQFTDDGVWDLLNNGRGVVYAGFDPTASSLHMGNLLQIVHLRRLQLAGNKPILLAGGGTGLIGDPTAKAAERPLLTVEQLEHNVASVRTQLERYIDFSPGSAQAILLDNAAWLTKISLTDFLRDTGKHFTVNQMVAKDSVKSRFEREDVGISFTEFSYMLLQAYDFLHLHREHGCNIQIGGSDQWGNITMGVELVRKVAGNQVFGLTTPLLLKSDGTKFGKSDHGAVYLDPSLTSPFAMHQFLLNTEDDMVVSLLNFFTFLSRGEIDELAAATESAPQERRAQRALADAVVGFVHSPEAATAASEAGRALFSEDIASLSEAMFIEVLADAPSSSVSRAELEEGIDLVDLLVRASLASSRGEARRFVEQGGVYLNNVKSQSEKVGLDSLLHDRYIVLRRGRRNTHLVKVG